MERARDLPPYGVRLLSHLTGEDASVLDLEQPGLIISNLLQLRGPYRTNERQYDYTKILEKIFVGLTVREIARQQSTTPESLDASVRKFFRVVKANLPEGFMIKSLQDVPIRLPLEPVVLERDEVVVIEPTSLRDRFTPIQSRLGAVSFGMGPLDPDEDARTAWRADAVCAQTDPELFFPEKGGSTNEAKKICTTCDMKTRLACLAYAMASEAANNDNERFGIWGGLSVRERRAATKQGLSPQQALDVAEAKRNRSSQSRRKKTEVAA